MAEKVKKVASSSAISKPSRPEEKKHVTKNDLLELRKELRSKDAEIKRLNALLVDDQNSAYCYMCDKRKIKSDFYVSTDPLVLSHITPICKECARKIAYRVGVDGVEHEPDKESAIKALRYLNKPYYEKLWHDSIIENTNENSGKKKSNTWNAYIKNISMINYNTQTFADSDFLRNIIFDKDTTPVDIMEARQEQDAYVNFDRNKRDVIRLLNYDPFEHEDVNDQPLLYSQLLGMLDQSEDANDDMMRTASAITIVRSFLQQSKIDDALTRMMGDYSHIGNNAAAIKSLQDSKKNITSVIKDLAAESCISLKNNKQAKKGENTWTGKIKKIKELNLREGEVNGFDINTCRAMEQIMNISNRALLQQLKLDESEYGEIVATQREMVTDLTKERDIYQEINRILLRENLDLRSRLEPTGLMEDADLVDLDDLFSPFSTNQEEE